MKRRTDHSSNQAPVLPHAPVDSTIVERQRKQNDNSGRPQPAWSETAVFDKIKGIGWTDRVAAERKLGTFLT